MGEIGGNSVTLNWDEPPPVLESDPPRTITQYEIILTPQDGGEPIIAFAPAEAGSSVEVTGLEPETMYDVEVRPVVETEGAGEEAMNFGRSSLTVTTSKYYIMR